MKLVQEKYGTIEYDPSVPCITATFTSFMKSEQFRDFLNKGLVHLIEKKKLHRKILWLADTGAHRAQPVEDTQWVADEWNPRALKAGIHHVAFVLPQSQFGSNAVKSYAKSTEKNADQMTIEIFGSVDAAKEWFKELYPVAAIGATS
jgi:hypothetical protein